MYLIRADKEDQEDAKIKKFQGTQQHLKYFRIRFE